MRRRWRRVVGAWLVLVPLFVAAGPFPGSVDLTDPAGAIPIPAGSLTVSKTLVEPPELITTGTVLTWRVEVSYDAEPGSPPIDVSITDSMDGMEVNGDQVPSLGQYPTDPVIFDGDTSFTLDLDGETPDGFDPYLFPGGSVTFDYDAVVTLDEGTATNTVSVSCSTAWTPGEEPPWLDDSCEYSPSLSVSSVTVESDDPFTFDLDLTVSVSPPLSQHQVTVDDGESDLADETVGDGDVIEVTGIEPGTYTVTVPDDEGVIVTAVLSCADGNGFVTDLGDGEFTIDLSEPDDEESCTLFLETGLAAVSIAKEGPEGYVEVWEFDGEPIGLPLFAGTVSGDDGTFFDELVGAGSVSIHEEFEEGTPLLDCGDGEPGEGDEIDEGIFVWVVSVDGSLSCVLENPEAAEPGTITIVKSAPDAIAGEVFAFDSDFGGFALGDGGSQELTEVAAPGSYTFEEQIFASDVRSGWYLDSVSCDDDDSGLSDGVLVVELESGEDVECTFANAFDATTLTVHKSTSPDTDEDFEFQLTAAQEGIPVWVETYIVPGNGELTIELDPYHEYTLEELVDDDSEYVPVSGQCFWSEVFESFDEGDEPVVDIGYVGEGEDWECEFFNEGPVVTSITIAKDASPATEADFEFLITGFVGGGDDVFLPYEETVFVPGDGSEVTVEVPPGIDYQVEEVLDPESGYDPVSGDCSWSEVTESFGPGDPPIVEIGSVDPGNDWQCEFVNEAATGLTVTKQATPDTDQDFTILVSELVFGEGGFFVEDVAQLQLGDGETSAMIPLDPDGLYLVEEFTDGATGYGIIDGSCTGVTGDDWEFDGSGVSFTPSAGDQVDCVLENATTTLTLVKDADPAEGEFQVAVYEVFPDEVGEILEEIEGSPFTVSGDGTPSAPIELSGGSEYVLEELGPDEPYELVDGFCSNEAELDGGQIRFGVDGGDAVTCTFVNEADLGSLTITKVADPADGTDFGFTGDLDGFTLDVDDDEAVPDSVTFTDLAAGDYSVTEAVPDGWQLTGIDCGEAAAVIADTTVTVTVDVDDVECVFTNEALATVTITKAAALDDGTGFDFTVAAAVVTGDATPTLGVGESETVAVSAGAVTISEVLDLPTGWTLSAVDCGETDVGIDVEAGTVDADLEPGDVLECTFTNDRAGLINVVKAVVGDDDGTTFGFTTANTDLAAFTLTDGSGVTLVAGAGPVTITETATDGFVTTITCTDGSVGANEVTLTVASGAVVDCTVTNVVPAGSLTVTKDSVPDTDTAFTITVVPTGGGGAETLVLTDDGTGAADTGSLDLDPGTYTLTETNPLDGTTVTTVCSDGTVGDAVTTITIAADTDLACVITNQSLGTITVTKQVVSDGLGDPEFDFAGDLGPFTLDTDDGTETPAAITFDDLAAGTYTITELVPDGWAATVDCGAGPAPLATATIDLDPAEAVECVFTNTELGSLTVTKSTSVATDLVFPIAFDGPGGGFGVTDGSITVVDDLTPGTYTLSETLPPAWIGTWDCGDSGTGVGAAATVIVTVTPGADVTCDLVNTLQVGTVTITKVAPIGADGATDFEFASDELGSFTVAASDSVVFDQLEPGPFSVTELVPEGWTLGSIVCTGADDTTTDGATVSFALPADGAVECQFTNIPNGSFTLTKTVVSPGSGQVTDGFTVTGPDGTTVALAHGDTIQLALPAGAYTVSETGTQGWTAAISCTVSEFDGSSTTVTGSLTVDFVVASGATVVCSLVNTAPAQVTVVSATTPDTDTEFSFTGPDGPFTLTGNESRIFAGLGAGSVTFTRAEDTTWPLVGLDCIDTNGGATSTVTVAGNAITVDVLAGDSLICVFAAVETEIGEPAVEEPAPPVIPVVPTVTPVPVVPVAPPPPVATGDPDPEPEPEEPEEEPEPEPEPVDPEPVDTEVAGAIILPLESVVHLGRIVVDVDGLCDGQDAPTLWIDGEMVPSTIDDGRLTMDDHAEVLGETTIAVRCGLDGPVVAEGTTIVGAATGGPGGSSATVVVVVFFFMAVSGAVVVPGLLGGAAAPAAVAAGDRRAGGDR